MSTRRPERDALLQRLQSSYPDLVAASDHDIMLWQGYRIYCGPLPSDTPLPAVHLEVCRLWPDAGPHTGLLLAGNPAALAACQPLWQTLSGPAQAWLYCGPAGAAGFCKRVFDSLFYLASPALVQHAVPAHGTASRLDWPVLLQQHQLLADRLQQLCLRYLQRHGLHDLPQDSDTVLALFRIPPQQQNHYALTLAQLLAIALTLSEPARQLLAAWDPLAVTPQPVA